MTAPTLAAVRVWLAVPASSLSDEQLAGVIAAELAAQAAVCTVGDPYPPDLAAALLRRCARHVAAKSLPTGLVGDTEYGVARLPGVDAEIDRLERHHRTQVLA